MLMIRIIVRVHCHYTGKYRPAEHRICNLKYNIPEKIPIDFLKGSSYFITTKLREKLEGKFSCQGVNTEKYITFSVPLKT